MNVQMRNAASYIPLIRGALRATENWGWGGLKMRKSITIDYIAMKSPVKQTELERMWSERTAREDTRIAETRTMGRGGIEE